MPRYVWEGGKAYWLKVKNDLGGIHIRFRLLTLVINEALVLV